MLVVSLLIYPPIHTPCRLPASLPPCICLSHSLSFMVLELLVGALCALKEAH